MTNPKVNIIPPAIQPFLLILFLFILIYIGNSIAESLSCIDEAGIEVCRDENNLIVKINGVRIPK